MNVGALIKFTVSLTTRHNLHISACCKAKPARAGRVMRKIMGYNTSRKKRIFSESGILPTASMFSKGSEEGRYSGSAKRASVLNKLFMRYITDLMFTGEHSPDFLGHNIEISRVKMTPDYKGLNVYWVAKGTEDDEVVEKLLKKNAGFLRHELSGLRVMGVVPTIYFVKDKQYSEIIEVDARLAKADFGDDYERPELGSKLKAQLELQTPLPKDIKNKIEQLDSAHSEDNIDSEELLPPMPQNVLGLNHAEILNKIKKNMKTSEATHRFNSAKQSIPHTVNENPIEFESNQEQRAVFKDFLEKRELLQSKARKLDKKYMPDIEYMREESLQEHIERYSKGTDIYHDEADYVDEDDDVKDNCK